MAKKKLSIFVAMPGTDMGTNAAWKNPNEIKRFFLEPIKHQLETETSLEVDIRIEKDKEISGNIYSSMFKEAWEADVYIADLTGSNANVYLELGVRWAMKDATTILVCQNVSDVKFNVAATRVIPYGANPATNEAAIQKVIQAILYGLKNNSHCDSPVREKSPIKMILVEDYENLVNEIDRLKSERGEELYSAAQKSTDINQKIILLQKAVEKNPTFYNAYYLLGVTLRKNSNYPEAIKILKKSIDLEPESAFAYRELGVTYSKNGDLNLAVKEFNNSLNYDPNDFDTLSALGGTYRKLGMNKAPEEIDWDVLKKSKECYKKAGELNPHDTYPLLNVAKLDLIISKIQPENQELAKRAFDELKDLCSYQARQALKKAQDNPSSQHIEHAYWRIFDHADSLLFSGKLEEGKKQYQDGLNFVPDGEKISVISSVCSPLKNYIAVNVLDTDTKNAVEIIISELESAIKG